MTTFAIFQPSPMYHAEYRDSQWVVVEGTLPDEHIIATCFGQVIAVAFADALNRARSHALRRIPNRIVAYPSQHPNLN